MSDIVQWIVVGAVVVAAFFYMYKKIKRSSKGECGGCCSGCKYEENSKCSEPKDRK